MANDITTKWIKAAEALRNDPDLKVICPNCNSAFLRVEDVVVSENGKCDRYLICDNCKAYNVVTFNIQKK